MSARAKRARGAPSTRALQKKITVAPAVVSVDGFPPFQQAVSNAARGELDAAI